MRYFGSNNNNFRSYSNFGDKTTNSNHESGNGSNSKGSQNSYGWSGQMVHFLEMV